MIETSYITEQRVRERISNLMAEAGRERIARSVQAAPTRSLARQALELVQVFLKMLRPRGETSALLQQARDATKAQPG